MLDVRKLVLLAEVVEAGSITAAATALNYTPSAVSQQLRQLEIEVGQPCCSANPEESRRPRRARYWRSTPGGLNAR